MKTSRYAIIVLALLVCMSASAAKKVKKSKKQEVAEKVDTIPMRDFSILPISSVASILLKWMRRPSR